MSLLSLENLSFGYHDQQLIFENISFDVHPGEIFCVIGPNGCGKTTLIDCILGINHPSAGSIHLSGNDLHKLKPREFAQNIAYVPQSHAKTFPYTVLDIVVMGRTHVTKLFASPDTTQRNRALECLVQVGLKGFENRLYTELSGGELQLVLIARALAQDAKIMILDEPFKGMDDALKNQVLPKLAKSWEESGKTVILVTHDLSDARKLSHSIYELSGRPVNCRIKSNIEG